MALPEEDIKNLLDDGGFLDSWVDQRGTLHAKPVTQVGMLIEQELECDERCVMIRKSGGSGADEYLRNPIISIYMMGTISDAHLIIAERIGEMLDYVLDNYKSGCTIGATVQGDIEGPYLMASGRPAYEFNIQTTVER